MIVVATSLLAGATPSANLAMLDRIGVAVICRRRSHGGLQRVLHLLGNELGSGRGTVTSGNIIGQNAAGVTNSSLGSWSYTASASKP